MNTPDLTELSFHLASLREAYRQGAPVREVIGEAVRTAEHLAQLAAAARDEALSLT